MFNQSINSRFIRDLREEYVQVLTHVLGAHCNPALGDIPHFSDGPLCLKLDNWDLIKAGFIGVLGLGLYNNAAFQAEGEPELLPRLCHQQQGG